MAQLTTIMLSVDVDDERDIHRAIAFYQRTILWPPEEGGGTLLPEGDSDLRGAILGEICRGWLEQLGE